MEGSLWTKTSAVSKLITSEGGVVVGEGVRLMCPPGAVDNPVNVTITLVDPSKHCGLLVQKDLENDVMFCAPIISLQPSGHFFKKPVELTSKFSVKNFTRDEVVILHGTEARDGRIIWQDINHNAKIDETHAELNIKTERFSIIIALLAVAVAVRKTYIRTKDIVSRLNLMAFNYTISVLLNDKSNSNELALLFVSQDVYQEQFYREDETSALVRLEAEGFRELCVRSVDDQKEKCVYNYENLEVSVCLGEDYKLSDGKHSLVVGSSDWWSTGYVIKLPLESTKDVRILCGKINVKGEYGHSSEKHFCELGELDNYNMTNFIY